MQCASHCILITLSGVFCLKMRQNTHVNAYVFCLKLWQITCILTFVRIDYLYLRSNQSDSGESEAVVDVCCWCCRYYVVDNGCCWWLWMLSTMDVDDACQQWMLSPLSGWLLFVVFIFQFVADVGCLLHLLSKCCCRPLQDSTRECNVMMQCASHHIFITLSGWLLFVILCCMLLYAILLFQ